jgi:hypothetical protein
LLRQLFMDIAYRDKKVVIDSTFFVRHFNGYNVV